MVATDRKVPSPLFSNIETLLPLMLATTRSFFPSPLKSSTARVIGLAPATRVFRVNDSVAVAPGCVMVYVAVATALAVRLGAVAIALIVPVVVSVTGPVYCVDDVVGVLPSMV